MFLTSEVPLHQLSPLSGSACCVLASLALPILYCRVQDAGLVPALVLHQVYTGIPHLYENAPP